LVVLVNIEEARAVIWGPGDWEEGIAHCVAMIEPHLIYGGSVLDYGCGIGRLTKPLAKRHNRTQFIGVDIDSKMLDFAREDARKNEWYYELFREPWMPPDLRPWMPPDLRSAFSVITFQHMPDPMVAAVIVAVYPAKFRFQFAIGDVQAPYNYQRSPEVIEDMCLSVGYYPEVSEDPRFPTWRWVTAR
jgi:SAM-dependent methyltransferase